jgi:PhnB protein
MAVKSQPEGYHTITPYLIVKDGVKAIDFYKKAFGAIELFRMPGPGGKIMHAEIKIGDSVIMLADEVPEMGARSPTTIGGSPVGILVYVTECDEVFAEALEAGATVKKPMQDQFYGDRSGTVIDPFGHVWTIATHKEDLAPEEIERRFDEMMTKGR